MTDAETLHDEREQARDFYETAVRVVDYQSGGRQPPLASQPAVVGILVRKGYEPASVRTTIATALENGDLFRWSGDDGSQYLGLDDVDALRDKIGSHAERRDDPNRGLISIASQRIQHLQEDD